MVRVAHISTGITRNSLSASSDQEEQFCVQFGPVQTCVILRYEECILAREGFVVIVKYILPVS